MIPVVIDASAGVELVSDTIRGRALRKLLPPMLFRGFPSSSMSSAAAVLRRWDLNTILTPEEISAAMDALMAWPLRVVQVRGLLADAWRRRANITFPDAIYVALADHLGADLLTDDQKLANTPKLPVRPLHLPPRA